VLKSEHEARFDEAGMSSFELSRAIKGCVAGLAAGAAYWLIAERDAQRAAAS
jgi:hypothetical protein